MSDNAHPTRIAARTHRVREFVAASVLWACAIAVALILIWILADVACRGLSSLSWRYLYGEPEDAGRQGGIGSILISTLLLLVVSLALAGPVSLATAVALSESVDAPFHRTVRFCLDVLAATPSIVFGLFGNALFCVAFGMGYSILSGGLTLACMVLPILTRTTEQALRGVPDEYRFAAASLGLDRSATLRRVILPVAAPAMATGLILSIGRVLAETAALIFTAGYVSRTPRSLFDSGRSLSVHVYDLAMNVPGGNDRAYAAAIILVVLVLAVNAIAIRLTRLLAPPVPSQGVEL